MGEAKILQAIGLGALLGTVSMGIGLLAGTITIAGATAAVAMGTAAVVGIGAMIGAAALERKCQQNIQPPVVVIQAQGQGQAIVQTPAIEQDVKLNHGKFTQMILEERSRENNERAR